MAFISQEAYRESVRSELRIARAGLVSGIIAAACVKEMNILPIIPTLIFSMPILGGVISGVKRGAENYRLDCQSGHTKEFLATRRRGEYIIRGIEGGGAVGLGTTALGTVLGYIGLSLLH